MKLKQLIRLTESGDGPCYYLRVMPEKDVKESLSERIDNIKRCPSIEKYASETQIRESKRPLLAQLYKVV